MAGAPTFDGGLEHENVVEDGERERENGSSYYGFLRSTWQRSQPSIYVLEIYFRALGGSTISKSYAFNIF